MKGEKKTFVVRDEDGKAIAIVVEMWTDEVTIKPLPGYFVSKFIVSPQENPDTPT